MTTLLDSMQSRHAAGEQLTHTEQGELLESLRDLVNGIGMKEDSRQWNKAELAWGKLTAPARDVQPLVPAVKPEPHNCRWVKLATGGWHVRCNHGEVWWNSAPAFCHRCGLPVLEMFAPVVKEHLTTEPEPQEVCEWKRYPAGWISCNSLDWCTSKPEHCHLCGKPIREVRA